VVLDSVVVETSLRQGTEYYFITGSKGFDDMPDPTASDARLTSAGIGIPVQNSSDRLYIKVLGKCEGCEDVYLKALVRNWKFDINFIAPKNLVTEYDVSVQTFLIDGIRSLIPDAAFLAEEDEGSADCLKSCHCFIIDPIDGTANFVHGYRHSCISVAMLEYGEVKCGAVYDPYQDELFTATLGGGTFVNGKPVWVSHTDLSHALVTFGSSPYRKKQLAEKTFAIIKELFLTCSDVRRSGSAALDMAYLAAGRTDAFFELVLSPWDYAAGKLLIKEAGGIVTDARGEQLPLGEPSSVVAASSDIYGDILKTVGKYI
jgi:myo-inositol-1(or 4)-monophosphatase